MYLFILIHHKELVSHVDDTIITIKLQNWIEIA